MSHMTLFCQNTKAIYVSYDSLLSEHKSNLAVFVHIMTVKGIFFNHSQIK